MAGERRKGFETRYQIGDKPEYLVQVTENDRSTYFRENAAGNRKPLAIRSEGPTNPGNRNSGDTVTFQDGSRLNIPSYFSQEKPTLTSSNGQTSTLRDVTPADASPVQSQSQAQKPSETRYQLGNRQEFIVMTTQNDRSSYAREDAAGNRTPMAVRSEGPTNPGNRNSGDTVTFQDGSRLNVPSYFSNEQASFVSPNGQTTLLNKRDPASPKGGDIDLGDVEISPEEMQRIHDRASRGEKGLSSDVLTRGELKSSIGGLNKHFEAATSAKTPLDKPQSESRPDFENRNPVISRGGPS